jgi:REP element-mobilizing transposase RayT/AraC-like DNA-binding protein
MPRGPRIDSPGLAHHVWHRGVGRRDIFLDASDCEDFVDRVRRLAVECGIRCFAWALLDNHFHLVVQTSETRLATFMARLMTGYARHFNARHGHVGHVLQNRYGSRVIEDDTGLATVVVYVNRNPLEAGLVRTTRELAQFPWTSFGALVGARRPLEFEAVGAALSLFGRDTASARRELRVRVARPAPAPPAEPPEPRIHVSALPAARAIRFAAIVREACRPRRVGSGEVRGGSRRPAVVDARARVAKCARAVGFTRREISRELAMSESALCRLLRRDGGSAT